MAHRYSMSDEDVDAGYKAYEWPKRMTDIMKEAQMKSSMEHKEFEAQLKQRRKMFGEALDQYALDVETYHTKGDIVKRDQISQEVQDLSEKLREAALEAEQINVQEKLFSWAPTKYSNISKLTSSLEPYVSLWTTLSEAYDKFSTWMNGPFIRLNPEEVDAETSESFRKLYKLTKVGIPLGPPIIACRVISM